MADVITNFYQFSHPTLRLFSSQHQSGNFLPSQVVTMHANSSTNNLGSGVSETDWHGHHHDYDAERQQRASVNPSISSRNSSPRPPTIGLATTTARAPLNRQPSVRIRRFQPQQSQQHQHVQFASTARADGGEAGDGSARPEFAATGRRRSSSDPRPAPSHAMPPQSHGLTRSVTGLSGLPTLNEEDTQGQGTSSVARGPAAAPNQRPGMFQRASTAAMSALGKRQPSRYDNGQAGFTAGSATGQDHQEYDENFVNILDVVGTYNHLCHINSSHIICKDTRSVM